MTALLPMRRKPSRACPEAEPVPSGCPRRHDWHPQLRVAPNTGSVRLSTWPTGSVGMARRRTTHPGSWRCVPTISGHGPDLDSGGSQELADLGGVFENVKGHAADNHSVQGAVVSMGRWQWPSGSALSERGKRSAHPVRGSRRCNRSARPW